MDLAIGAGQPERPLAGLGADGPGKETGPKGEKRDTTEHKSTLGSPASPA